MANNKIVALNSFQGLNCKISVKDAEITEFFTQKKPVVETGFFILIYSPMIAVFAKSQEYQVSSSQLLHCLQLNFVEVEY